MTSKQYQAQHGRGATTAPAKANKPPSAAKAKKPPSAANALTKAIIRLLILRGFHAWRQNNAAVYDPTRQVFRSGSSTKGISDVLGYHKRTARMAAVEVKVGADKLSPEQTDFLAGVKRAGGFACEARSLAQAEAELNSYLYSSTPFSA